MLVREIISRFHGYLANFLTFQMLQSVVEFIFS